MGKKEEEEIKKTKTVENGVTIIKDETAGNDDAFMVQSITKVSKEVHEYSVTMDRMQGRYLVDQFYQHQQHRINAASQLRAVEQGYDTKEDIPENLAIQYIYTNARITEKNIEKLLKSWVETQPVGLWLMDNKGIGPVLASCILANFDITKCTSAGQFWSYAGLNDNKAPWLGTSGADDIDKRLIEKFGKDYMKTETIETIIANVADMTNRSYSSVEKQIRDPKEGNYTRKSLKAGLAKPPYNKDLKLCMFKIGESFIKVSNRGSKYGEIFQQRKAWEHVQNDKGLYAEEAAKQLKAKNFGKETDARKAYEEGKLPDGHIMARSRRYATKLFISHVFEAMYYDYHGVKAPNPYAISYLGHVDYIEPEVPFSKIDEYKKALNK